MQFENELKPYIEDKELLYNTNKNYRLRSDYYDSYISCEIKEKTIMYEAFFGRGITCNPGELFKFLLNDSRFSDWEHIWSLEESEFRDDIIAQYSQYDNVKFVVPFTKEYFDALSSAKYLINNSTWQNYFSKKEGQVVVNTWHGIPLKSMAYDAATSDNRPDNTVRNFLFSDYVISPVEFTTDNFKTAFKLDGIFEGKIIEAGYPRIDATFNSSRQNLKKELEKYGVEYDDNKKLILYAPTWKGNNFSSPDITIGEYDKILDTINSHIDTDEYQVLFKPHQIVYKTMVQNGVVKKEYIPAQINTNVLLGATDVLISDYSSIFFDFLVTGRPIYFYVPDLEEYKTSRGLYFSIENLPGPVTKDIIELAQWLENIDNYKQLFDYANYENAVKKFVSNDDGNACKRVVDAVFFGDDSNCKTLKTNKKKLLIHMDMILLNGISFSLFNLINNLDTNKYDVTFFSNGSMDIAAPYLKGFPKDIRVLLRNGANPVNPETDARKVYCIDKAIIQEDNNPIFPTEFYQMEYNRCFGDAKFDCIINFSGFSAFYANMYYSRKSCRQLIWMHSVMQSEYKRVSDGKFVFKEKLNCIYKLYKYLDKYVSCSKTTMLENRRDLATDETYHRFTYAKNLINAQRVLDGRDNKSIVEFNGREYIYVSDKESETIIPKPNNSGLCFVTVGRLAYGKNHDLLIKAFAKFSNDNPDAMLYIIGDGPLKSQLRKLISSLKLTDKVILTGNLTNPFAVMDNCDCFILPSTYEGQPMVILEARILGLPIIVSNFATVKDSMYENGQLVIGMETEDIYEALVKFKNGQVPNEFKFDYKRYNEEAIAEFESCLE